MVDEVVEGFVIPLAILDQILFYLGNLWAIPPGPIKQAFNTAQN